MTLAEREVIAQRKELEKVNNYRFPLGDNEYRILYRGGVAEFITVQSRRKGTEIYRFLKGFSGYNFHIAEELIDYVKHSVLK